MTTIGPNARGASLALLGFAVYSSHDAVIKALSATYSTFQIMFFATILGFPLLVVMMLADRAPLRLVPRNPGWMAVRSGGVVLSGLSGFYAFSVLPLAQTYALLFAAPLLITLLAIPVLGETVGLRRALAVLAGFAGVMIVLRPGEAPIGPGHVAALCAAFCAAIAAVASRRIGREERPAVMVVWPMLTTFVVMGAAQPFVYVPVAPFDLLLLAYVAVCSFAALLCIVMAYRLAEAAVVAPMQYSQIVWAALFGALFFGETPDLWTFAGAGVIIASGVYIVWREARGSASANRPVITTRARPQTGSDPGAGPLP